MRGWNEEEFADRRLMAPCGLYCGTCGVYIAYRDGNTKFRDLLARLYGTPSEQTVCLGCMQEDGSDCLYEYCRSCKIRDCVRGKGYYSCHQCADWPCSHIEAFPLPIGKRVMQRAIPRWRALVAEQGDEQGSVAWARGECERYHCAHCRAPLFRGARRCRECKRDIADELDGRS